MRVIDVVAAHQDGLTPEEILREYSTLDDTADVYAALLYYHDHKQEIENDIAEGERLQRAAERERVRP